MGSQFPWGSQNRKTTLTAPIEAALSRLLSENSLRLSERNKRFLTYVVREALAGRGGRIKAYTIGVDVFGRGENFDPANDPIVRIEATRIRSALAGYYQRGGSSERIKILIPPGSYVPVFEGTDCESVDRLDEDCPRSLRRSANLHPAIVVSARSDSHERASAILLELLKHSIVARLRKMELRVFLSPAPEPGSLTRPTEQPVPLAAVYSLDIALYTAVEGQRQVWLLTDLRTGELLGTMVNDHPAHGALSTTIVDEIVDAVQKMIGYALMPNGPCVSSVEPLTAGNLCSDVGTPLSVADGMGCIASTSGRS
jgi:hypothetical protein